MPLPTLLQQGFLVAQNQKDVEAYKKIIHKYLYDHVTGNYFLQNVGPKIQPGLTILTRMHRPIGRPFTNTINSLGQQIFTKFGLT